MDMYQKRKMRTESKGNNKEDASTKVDINWFPGHMAKTRRKIKESLSLVDGVIELRDARIPYSSVNPELNELIENKPKMILLNKADLADEKITAEWLDYYKTQGITAIAVDCKSGKGLNILRSRINELLADKIKSYEEKGMSGKALRLMVVGIPNTGKSSFINRLSKSGKGKAKVEDRAGVTRNNQWYVIGDRLELLDTPGVLWPKFDDQNVAFNLAFTGGIKDQILDIEELASHLLTILAKNYPEMLNTRYKISDFEDMQGYEILEYIGKKRGMLISKGEVDTLRAATMLFDELRAGKLGKISFERPNI